MRCPKCSYLSYDEVERCRNCGYDFSLALPERDADPPVLEPPLETRAWEPSPRRASTSPLVTTPPAEGAALDLPLFEDPVIPEPPPVAIPPAGPPLSVRRKIDLPRPSRGEPTRSAVEPEAGTVPMEFDWPEDAPAASASAATPASAPDPYDAASESEAVLASGVSGGRRVAAGAIDAALLIGLDVLVVWLTLRVAGLPPASWHLLPLVPLAGFLFLLDLAYLVTFTAASGQSIGKMILGLRVVSIDGGRVPFGHAVLRSAVVLLCALPAGLGLLFVLLDDHGRGVHDRLAGTHVLKP